MPKISFIIPYYNVPVALLQECVESILALPLKKAEREIIVVDDGSAESPAEMLKTLGDDIIYIWQENEGASAARNAGMERATGEYMQFVDSDDTLLTNSYVALLNVLDADKPDMIVFDYTGDANSHARATESRYDSGADYMLHNNLHASPCSLIFKREIAGGIRFRKGLLNEDEEFTPLIILASGRLCASSRKAYYYRRREGSLTTINDNKRLLRRLDDMEDVIMRLNSMKATLSQSKAAALQRRVAQLTMDYLFNCIVFTRSSKELSERVSRLRRLGLYPLPLRPYTRKYLWFSRVANTRFGLKLMLVVLSIIKHQR